MLMGFPEEKLISPPSFLLEKSAWLFMESCGCHGDEDPTWEYLRGVVDIEEGWCLGKIHFFMDAPYCSPTSSNPRGRT